MASDSAKLDAIISKLKKLDTLEGKIDDFNNRFESLSNKVTSNTNDIAAIRDDLDKFKVKVNTDIRSLRTSHNNREQRLRSSTIRIFNVPYTRGESLDNFKGLTAKVYDRIIRPTLVAAKSAGDIGSVQQQQNVIDSCFRAFTARDPAEASPQTPPPPVIVRLANNSLKGTVMKFRKSVTDLSEGERDAGGRRFIIVEDLTPDTHKLLRELQQDARTDKVWSVNGVISYTLVGKAGVTKVKNVYMPVSEILADPPA